MILTSTKQARNRPERNKGMYIHGKIPVREHGEKNGMFFEPVRTHNAAVLFDEEGAVYLWNAGQGQYSVYSTVHKARRATFSALQGYNTATGERSVLTWSLELSERIREMLVVWRQLSREKREEVVGHIDAMTERLEPRRAHALEETREIVAGMVGILDDTGRVNPIATVAKLVHRVEPAIIARAFVIDANIIPRLLSRLLVLENEIRIAQEVSEEVSSALESCPLLAVTADRRDRYWRFYNQRVYYVTRLANLVTRAVWLRARPYRVCAKQVVAVQQRYADIVARGGSRHDASEVLMRLRRLFRALALYEQLRSAYEMLQWHGTDAERLTYCLDAYRIMDMVVQHVRAKESFRSYAWGRQITTVISPMLTRKQFTTPALLAELRRAQQLMEEWFAVPMVP